ncbi:MAG: hypothetical protein RJA36_1697 [Pseudomonadota bacterium]|jgi:hypothetical protein
MHRSTAQRPALVLALSALLACSAGAQTAAPAATPPKTAIEQRAEVITHEDAGSRIDELRVGGETRHIDVRTKSALPPYQVQPINTSTQGNPGRSSWRLMSF